MAIKITDLVDPNEIEKIRQLDAELSKVLDTYTRVAKDLAKGLEISVNVVGDIDRLEKVLVDKGKEAMNVQEQLTRVIDEQGKVVANTTNTISRHLMEQERVNKTQREAYTEYERVKKLLDQFHDTYEGQTARLVKLNNQLEANKKAQKDNERALSLGRVSMAQYNAVQAELITQHRALTQEKRSLTQLMTAEEKAAQATEGSYSHMSQQLELLKKAYKDLDEEGRNTEFGKEMEEAIQNLDAHLKDMAADMGEFQRNTGNYAIANNTLKKKYEELVGTLAALQSAYGKLTAEQKESDAGQELAANIEEVKSAATETKEALDEQTKALDEAKQSLGETSGKTSSVKRDLKELVLEIANLTIEYQNLSEEEKESAEGQELAEHIRDLTEKAGVLKDAISDTNAAITNAASDTRGFDQLSEGLQLAVDGFGLATGAASMFGLTSEEAADLQAKLMGAIAASNAMTKIQNALQQQSAIMQGVTNLQTKAGAIAVKLKTAAEGKGVVTTKLLTAAQWLFNKACYANPIGLLVLAIMACIAAVYGLIKVFTLFGSDSEKRKKNYEDEKRALDNLQKSNERAIAGAKARGASEWEAGNLSIQAKEAELAQAEKAFKAAREAYDKDDEKYKEALEAKRTASDAYWQSIEDNYNNVMTYLRTYYDEMREEEVGHFKFLKEKAQRDYEQQVETIKKKFEAEKEYLKARLVMEAAVSDLNSAEYNELKAKYNSLIAQENKFIADLGAARDRAIAKAEEDQKKKDAEAAKRAAEASKRAADDAKKREDAILKEQIKARQAELDLITDANTRKVAIENNNYENQKRELEKRISGLGETEVEMREALESQIRSLTAKHARTLADIELENATNTLNKQKEILGLKLDIVKGNSAEELELRKKIAANANEIELKAIERRVAKGEITEEEAAEFKRLLALNLANEIEEITQKHNDNLIKMAQDELAKEQAERDDKYVNDAAALKSKYAQDLLLAKGNQDEQERLTQKYNEDMAALDEQYAIKSAQAAVKAIEDTLLMEGLSANEREKMAADLAKAKADLANAVAEADKAAAESAVEADNKATEKRIANARQWLQVAADSLNSINELVSTVYDAKVAKVEEEQEVNTAASEAEQERITELVEKKVITEEEGEARKRAAEAQTARKNEELEKKKQKLKHKQAVWDKANSVSQAGIATALAIMNALQTKPFPVGIAMAAIAAAMGAVQVATILATPIPKYAKGTDRHKGGPAIVGDGGVPELVIFGDKSWITPDTPTLVDIPAGAIVMPDLDGIDDNTPGLVQVPMPANKPMPIIVNNDYKRLEEKMDTFISLMRKHINRQRLAAIDASLNNYINERI